MCGWGELAGANVMPCQSYLHTDCHLNYICFPNINKMTFKEMSSGSASRHHSRHAITFQKYIAYLVSSLKFRPDASLGDSMM